MFTLLRPRTEANQDIGNSFFLKPSILGTDIQADTKDKINCRL